MTEKNYSLAALERFMDFALSKNLMKKNTAQSRKAAAKKVLGILDEAEQSDLRNIDLEHAFERFQNAQGTDYTPDSLQVYKSRTKSALNDFLAYVENPAGFRPSGAQRSRTPTSKSKTVDVNQTEPREDFHGYSAPYHPPPKPQQIAVPVPLREGLTVQISGLPPDLTKAEATRLASIIQAYAVVEDK